MSKILDTMDELDKGLGFIRAASMAVRGSGLDPKELNALDRIMGAAEDSLEVVKQELEAINKAAPKD
jgi:hypothetical protein